MKFETILLVEDNEDDVFIFKRAYKQTGVPYPLQVVGDGQEAVDYLTGATAFSNRAQFPLPFLVFLDLKLPLKHGLEVLQVIRADPASSAICVIVLTSSAEPRDIFRAHELGAEAFLVKPPRADVISTAIEGVRARLTSPNPAARLKIRGDMFGEVAMADVFAIDPVGRRSRC